ncbi:MAG: DnaJ C-terminal domain-containing protein [Candidatus Dormibacterales bacterium]
MAEFKDYYQILGVPRDAGAKDVSRAFRKLARKHHPDVNPGDKQAEARFKEATEANEVLSDPEKRRLYDRFGKDWRAAQAAGVGADAAPTSARAGAGAQGGGPRVEYRTASAEDLKDLFGDENPFSEFFHSVFGRAARAEGGAPRPAAEAQGSISITLKEAYAGTTRTFQTPDEKRVEVKIPAGIRAGTVLRVPGLRVRVEVEDDPTFHLAGRDVETGVQVPLRAALLGGEVEVPTLKGGRVKLRVPEGTQNGTRLRLKGLGMPDPKGAGPGDLLAVVTVRLPLPLDEVARRLAEGLPDA